MSSRKNKGKAPPKLWGGRFSEATDPTVERFSASVHYDKALAHHDIRGSVAHARMLGRAGLIREATARSGWSPGDLRWIVPHQANGRLLKAAARRSGAPFDRFHLNIERVGNTSSASIPLALLEIEGKPLPALSLGDANRVREGEEIAFTGLPIGMVLGLYPVTHRGIVSAITPMVIPAMSSRQLSAKQIRRLRSPFNVLQLDATAYPGNSGSPVL